MDIDKFLLFQNMINNYNNPLFIFNCIYAFGINIDKMDITTKTINLTIPNKSEALDELGVSNNILPSFTKDMLIDSGIVDNDWKFLYRTRDEYWTREKERNNINEFGQCMANILKELGYEK